MSKISAAGATCLVAAAPLVIIGTLISPTISDEAADQVSAFNSHRAAMITGMTLSAIALVLLIGGTIWLALAVASRSSRLAVAGGVLGVFGSLVVLFENSLDAAIPSIVRGLDATQATAIVDRINSSLAVSGLEPVTILGDIGLLVLGIAAVKIGLSRWAAAALGVGALIEGAGFATSTKAVVVTGFVLVFAGAVMAVRAAQQHPAAEILPARAAAQVA
jgi:hypothetical protein